MASGASRVVVGAFIGTGAALSVAKVGFKPRSLTLWNETDPNRCEHIEGMADASMFKQKGGTTSLVTSQGITLTASGFSIGTDADINTDGERVFYVAHE